MYGVNFPPQTNVATFNPIVEIKDQDTLDLIDLSDIDICFEIRDDDDCVKLSQTKDSGILIIDVGYFQPVFENLRNLCNGTYRVHCTFTRDGTTRDMLVGSIPIVLP